MQEECPFELSDYLTKIMPVGVVINNKAISDILSLECESNSLLRCLELLRDDSNLKFTILIDLTAVDYPSNIKRFEVVYNLLSIKFNQRLIVKVKVADGENIESASDLFSAATWFEREAWDMYGIIFENNPDLRRILTDYGFSGHPLRKDFPLTGYVEVRYNPDLKKVVYEPVNLMQEYRNFDYLSPWEGTNYALPGDEKAGDKK
jgi:NADH-quinone oxidoreductase subunit C